jgi:hypothetical protein
MIIGFKERFKEPIIKGTKIHTIRIDAKNRWKPGNIMHMATGVRTKKYNQFNQQICKSVQNIEITRKSDYLNETTVKIDGRLFLENEVQQLAWNDGFDNLVDFWIWFEDGFKGKLLHWTDLRY